MLSHMHLHREKLFSIPQLYHQYPLQGELYLWQVPGCGDDFGAADEEAPFRLQWLAHSIHEVITRQHSWWQLIKEARVWEQKTRGASISIGIAPRSLSQVRRHPRKTLRPANAV